MDELLNPTAQLLVQKNLISFDLAYQYQQEAQAYACRLLSYLVAKSKICPKLVAQSLAEHFGFPWIDLEQFDSHCFPKLLTARLLLQQQHVLPIFYQDQYLVLAIDDPNHPIDLKEIQFLTQCPVLLHIVPTTQLSMYMDEWLRDTDQQGLTHYLNTQESLYQSFSPTLSEPYNDSYDEKPIVAFVQRILQQAVSRGATDLHFEPYADHYRIRYRQDGKLYELTRPTSMLAPRITSRLKVMANLNITERRLPQDGRFSFDVPPIQGLGIETCIDCRINTCPTIYGEKIAIRFLNTQQSRPNLDNLALTERDKICFLQAIHRPQGLILITGPTGSGKTVTLYAALEHLNTGDKNICSVEDPVEIKISGINQIQINPKIGLSFAEVLRAFLRQDPDIIMLGEIRDYETADIAMKAAHTGHLVLATLHTQNCVQTLLRLKQLGIATFLMSNLILIMTQRLFRMLCPYCKIPVNSSPNIYQAQGCYRCHQGYHGRKAIFEVMPISPAIQELILEPKLSSTKLSEQASKEGMLSLKQAGWKYVTEGVTTIEEISAIT
ncbi:MAG: GspE/PulE family protein [Gammaproteobacteria bacterium]